jgi:hypothetical protein
LGKSDHSLCRVGWKHGLDWGHSSRDSRRVFVRIGRYSREVLRSLAAGAFVGAPGGSPVHMLDDNIKLVTNYPLVPGKFTQADMVDAGVCAALEFVQQCALKADLHTESSKWALVGLEQVGSIRDSVSASVFGKTESYSCYKAVFIHAPRTEEQGVRYMPGLTWPEDVAFAHMLAKGGLHLLKVRWPFRFHKDTATKSTAAATLRLTVADLLAPWRSVKTLSSSERNILNEVRRGGALQLCSSSDAACTRAVLPAAPRTDCPCIPGR